MGGGEFCPARFFVAHPGLALHGPRLVLLVLRLTSFHDTIGSKDVERLATPHYQAKAGHKRHSGFRGIQVVETQRWWTLVRAGPAGSGLYIPQFFA
jgi:hypothetical protein